MTMVLARKSCSREWLIAVSLYPTHYPGASPALSNHVTSTFSNSAAGESPSFRGALIDQPNDMFQALRDGCPFAQQIGKRFDTLVFTAQGQLDQLMAER